MKASACEPPAASHKASRPEQPSVPLSVVPEELVPEELVPEELVPEEPVSEELASEELVADEINVAVLECLGV